MKRSRAFVILLVLLLTLISLSSHAQMAIQNASSGTASLNKGALKSPSHSTQKSDDLKQMNELIDAGNKSVEEANKQSADAGHKVEALFSAANLKDFFGKRAALKPEVDKVVGLLDKCIANLKNGADKFGQASELKIDDKLKDYYTMKAQSYRKAADLSELTKKQVKLVTDESIDNAVDFANASKLLEEKIDKLQQEMKSLEDRATKIQADNPNLFKKP